MLEEDYDAPAAAETKAASELWAADDAFRSVAPSHSEWEARAYLIAKYGDNSGAYEAWERAMTGRGHELRELFAEVAAWKRERRG
jgi:hypothetical protein